MTYFKGKLIRWMKFDKILIVCKLVARSCLRFRVEMIAFI